MAEPAVLRTYIGQVSRYGVVALTVLMSVLTSTHIRYVRVLSVWSMWTFGALVAAMWLASGMGVSGFLASVADLGEVLHPPAAFRAADVRLPRVLPVLVVLVEHHDRPVRRALRRRDADLAAGGGAAGVPVDPARGLVLSAVLLLPRECSSTTPCSQSRWWWSGLSSSSTRSTR